MIISILILFIIGLLGFALIVKKPLEFDGQKLVPSDSICLSVLHKLTGAYVVFLSAYSICDKIFN